MVVVTTKNSNNTTLEFVLPCQGYWDSSISALQLPTMTDIRGYYWVLDRNVDYDYHGVGLGSAGDEVITAPTSEQGQYLDAGYDKNYAYKKAYITGTDTRTGHNYYIYKRGCARVNNIASRGHNIRCVQEP